MNMIMGGTQIIRRSLADLIAERDALKILSVNQQLLLIAQDAEIKRLRAIEQKYQDCVVWFTHKNEVIDGRPTN